MYGRHWDTDEFVTATNELKESFEQMSCNLDELSATMTEVMDLPDESTAENTSRTEPAGTASRQVADD